MESVTDPFLVCKHYAHAHTHIKINILVKKHTLVTALQLVKASLSDFANLASPLSTDEQFCYSTHILSNWVSFT